MYALPSIEDPPFSLLGNSPISMFLCLDHEQPFVGPKLVLFARQFVRAFFLVLNL